MPKTRYSVDTPHGRITRTSASGRVYTHVITAMCPAWNKPEVSFAGSAGLAQDRADDMRSRFGHRDNLSVHVTPCAPITAS